MTMIIKKLIVGPLQENCYIVGDEDTKEAIVIDPGDEADRILDAAKDSALKIGSVVLTHAHFDHVGSAGDIKKATGARVMLHMDDLELYEGARDQAAFWGYELDDIPPPDSFLKDGDEVKVGGLHFVVLHTPGHSPGGICLYGEGAIFTGDTIFQGSVGRTDFHGGDMAKLRDSFRRLLTLPDNTVILSGHGPETTIGREKRENFFVNEI